MMVCSNNGGGDSGTSSNNHQKKNKSSNNNDVSSKQKRKSSIKKISSSSSSSSRNSNKNDGSVASSSLARKSVSFDSCVMAHGFKDGSKAKEILMNPIERSAMPPRLTAVQKELLYSLREDLRPSNSPWRCKSRNCSLALKAASTGDCASLLKVLSSDMCDVDVWDSSTGDTPLICACKTGHQDVVKLCLQLGASIDPHPNFGYTAIHAAVANKRFNILQLLLEHAASFEGKHAALMYVSQVDASNQHNYAPIHIAANVGCSNCAKILLEFGCDLFVLDSSSKSALHLACQADSIQTLQVMCESLDQGVLQEILEIQDTDGNTPIDVANNLGSKQCVEYLSSCFSFASFQTYPSGSYSPPNQFSRKMYPSIMSYKGSGTLTMSPMATVRTRKNYPFVVRSEAAFL